MSDILEWIVSHIGWFFGIVVAISLGFIMYSQTSYSRFQYEADQVVSRSGGLTKPAYDIINETGKRKYHSFFAVKLNDKQPYLLKPAAYGDDVTYKIDVNIPGFTWLGKTGMIKFGGYRTVQNDVRVDT